MKLATKLTNLGFEISLTEEGVSLPLLADPDASQDNPRGYYVYAHVDACGQVFYVGKGTGRRAWSKDRHPLWHRYVEKHLKGDYAVRILRDNLSLEESEEHEADWIAQCSGTLVNWVNIGRSTDFEALAEYHRLRTANRDLIESAKCKEPADLEGAAAVYAQAVEAIRTYAAISFEKGLVGQLLEEESAELGINGELRAMDRLSLCLIKLGRPDEAACLADRYFALYRRDMQLAAAARITKRIEKARRKAAPKV